MAIVCSRCGKHIAPMDDGGEMWLCNECIAAGHRLPADDDTDEEGDHAT